MGLYDDGNWDPFASISSARVSGQVPLLLKALMLAERFEAERCKLKLAEALSPIPCDQPTLSLAKSVLTLPHSILDLEEMKEIKDGIKTQFFWGLFSNEVRISIDDGFDEARAAKYKLLGSSLRPKASDEEVRLAYKSLALRFHPDKNKGSQAANNFRAVTETFKMLTDKSCTTSAPGKEISSTFILSNDCGVSWGRPDFLNRCCPTIQEVINPYIEDGKLVIKYEIRNIDGF